MKKRRKRKNCPECRYFWYSKTSHGCLKNNERSTYTTATLPTDIKEREWCVDMKKRKNEKTNKK